ncbi:AAA family ATPase [Streptosporangium sp. NPDC087985]|uniref:AAA family ATPase n=1 Tax=Streptosporangium sp. NPDC087985 TaxID=3366196 RepID=UPI0037F97ABB
MDYTAPQAGHVVMMCGVAGSGKTTYAQKLEARGYTRLSVDEEIWQRFGRYGVDYDPSAYAGLQEEAKKHLWDRFLGLLGVRQPVVLDYSFWQRATRDHFKSVIEEYGCHWSLVYLKVDPQVIRQRLAIRSERFDANAAFTITDEILSSYLNGFEEPVGEGE